MNNYIMLDGKKIPLSQETEQSLRDAQKDYKILEHEYAKHTWKTNKYKFNPEIHNIHSVKRLTDGEIFTVGDEIEQPKFIHGFIQRIEPRGNTVKLMYGAVNGVLLRNARKVEQPLFTTEDGVDIFEGDEYWGVSKDYFDISHDTKAMSYSGKSSMMVYFSTKEKAQEYIDLHKPKYSKKDIEEAIQKISVSINGGMWKQDILNVSFDKFWEKLDG